MTAIYAAAVVFRLGSEEVTPSLPAANPCRYRIRHILVPLSHIVSVDDIGEAQNPSLSTLPEELSPAAILAFDSTWPSRGAVAREERAVDGGAHSSADCPRARCCVRRIHVLSPDKVR